MTHALGVEICEKQITEDLKVIWCCRCRGNSIPAPPGASGHTRYTCRQCTGLGLAQGSTEGAEISVRGSWSGNHWMNDQRHSGETGAQDKKCRRQEVAIAPSIEIPALAVEMPLPMLRDLMAAGSNSRYLVRARKIGAAWLEHFSAEKIQLLSPSRKIALLMAAVLDLSGKEISSRLGISEPAVRSDISEAKLDLMRMSAGKFKKQNGRPVRTIHFRVFHKKGVAPSSQGATMVIR